jgi:flagellar biosynthesis component FlhA
MKWLTEFEDRVNKFAERLLDKIVKIVAALFLVGVPLAICIFFPIVPIILAVLVGLLALGLLYKTLRLIAQKQANETAAQDQQVGEAKKDPFQTAEITGEKGVERKSQSRRPPRRRAEIKLEGVVGYLH